MSGIRYLIALIFLFAGLESELRANASQATPASFSWIPSDIITNLNSKASVDKMTSTAPDRVHGILAERVIDTAPQVVSDVADPLPTNLAAIRSRDDAFRASGCSPPF